MGVSVSYNHTGICDKTIGQIVNELLTLNVAKSSTTHSMTASRPTGVVTLLSGSPNLGLSATERQHVSLCYKSQESTIQS